MYEIIGPLVEMAAADLLDFTRMTGELVKAMRACPQPIIAAIDGVCAGAGRDPRHGQRPAHRHGDAKVAFLFNRVGLAGCDMGACAILPRIIGQGRAAELLYTGRVLAARKPSAGASSTGWRDPDAVLARRSVWRASSPPAPLSPMP